MPTDDEVEKLKTEARTLAKKYALLDLQFYVRTCWSEERNPGLAGAVDHTRQRQILRDLLADLAD